MNNIDINGTSAKDWSGHVFPNGIKMIQPNGRRGKQKTITWECECFCGKHFTEVPTKIKSNIRKSCGCLASQNIHNAKMTKSFFNWCTETGNDFYLDLWDYKLNTKEPKDVSYRSEEKIYFKCINGNENHLSEEKYINHITDRGLSSCQCAQCNSFGQYIIDTFGSGYLENIWDYNKNIVSPFAISRCSATKVWIKCTDIKYHDSYFISCNKYYSGNRCPLCKRNSGKVHKNDSFAAKYPDIMNRWSTKNTLDPFNISPSTDKIIWLKCGCGKHDDYSTRVCNAVKASFMCPSCVNESTTSRLQNKVYDFINNELMYKVDRESECKMNMINPDTGRSLPYDNEIDELKLIVEVHGIQHYHLSGFHEMSAKRKGTSPVKEFELIKQHDKIKKEHALKNGYIYLEIPYTFETDDKYKQEITKIIR